MLFEIPGLSNNSHWLDLNVKCRMQLSLFAGYRSLAQPIDFRPFSSMSALAVNFHGLCLGLGGSNSTAPFTFCWYNFSHMKRTVLHT